VDDRISELQTQRSELPIADISNIFEINTQRKSATRVQSPETHKLQRKHGSRTKTYQVRWTPRSADLYRDNVLQVICPLFKNETNTQSNEPTKDKRKGLTFGGTSASSPSATLAALRKTFLSSQRMSVLQVYVLMESHRADNYYKTILNITMLYPATHPGRSTLQSPASQGYVCSYSNAES